MTEDSSDFSKVVKRPGRYERFSVSEVIDAIERSNGIIAGAAQMLRCHRDTVQAYIDRHPTVKAAYDAAWATNLDSSEHVILKALRSDRPEISVPVAKWLLMTKGKDRGYIEKVDIRVSIEQERQKVRADAEAQGLDADLAIAEWERLVKESAKA